MSENVLIKEVEGQNIWVREDRIKSLYYWELYVSMGIVIIGAMLAFSCYPYGAGSTRFNMGILISLLSIPALFVCITNPMGWFIKPAYVVHTSRVDSIVIFKTTPKVDQVAICCAAQELEAKIKEMVKEKRALEAIAGRCK